MRTKSLFAVAALLTFFSGSSLAQTVIPERQISLALAVDAAMAAVEKCRTDGFRITAVVIDRGGNVKATLRDDTTSPHTVETARKKAFTSLAFRIPSADFIARSETNPGLRSIDGTIALGGGLPIRSGNEVIAAIGVGGAPSGAADAACAQAGIDRITSRL